MVEDANATMRRALGATRSEAPSLPSTTSPGCGIGRTISAALQTLQPVFEKLWLSLRCPAEDIECPASLQSRQAVTSASGEPSLRVARHCRHVEARPTSRSIKCPDPTTACILCDRAPADLPPVQATTPALWQLKFLSERCEQMNATIRFSATAFSVDVHLKPQVGTCGRDCRAPTGLKRLLQRGARCGDQRLRLTKLSRRTLLLSRGSSL
jgi:hypothetical protein